MLKLSFDNGTLLVDSQQKEWLDELDDIVSYDARVKRHRAEAYRYADIYRKLHKKCEIQDSARDYLELNELEWDTPFLPRTHQSQAFDAWRQAQCRATVVLPTGSGKSFLAQMAINHIKRKCLVVVPTLDLVNQWQSQLERAFKQEIGVLGGGSKEVRDITVSTYDSALLMMEFIGNQFGLVIFDECHHLPGERNRLSATMNIAPYRLGLTATPERNDDGEEVLYKIVGPLAFRLEIDEIEGEILSPYRTELLELDLDPDEFEAYHKNRQVYKDFLQENFINFKNGNGWAQFIIACARRPNGQEAFKAFREQKRIASSGRAKLRCVWRLIQEHPNERIIVFTNDNNTAYEIGKTFLLPVLTHHTKLAERKDFLNKFRSGEYPILVTSKVLNEGVDVPEASVGIIVSGSGSTREHVQRLGRILRKSEGKQAVLFELISRDTSESFVSERRRDHRAYKR